MAKCYGMDPSEGMLEKAKRKNPSIVFKVGSHKMFPFEDKFFDLIYMTDVIHHIPNLDRLFVNLYSKIDTNGRICILTESHEQIETRWYNEFFPSLLMNEKARYPDIEEIKKCAEQNGLVNYKNNIRLGSPEIIVNDNFIKMVEEKNYSMFKLLKENEFKTGLKCLKERQGGHVDNSKHGETLMWLKIA